MDRNSYNLPVCGKHTICKLRFYQPDDFDAIYALYSNPKLTKYFIHSKPFDVDQVKDFVHNYNDVYVDRLLGMLCIIIDDNVVGMLGVTPYKMAEEYYLEIGYILDQKYHGLGIIWNSLIAIRDNLIPHICNEFKGICATVRPENTVSIYLLEKLGLQVYKQDVVYGNDRLFYKMEF